MYLIFLLAMLVAPLIVLGFVLAREKPGERQDLDAKRKP